MSSVTSVEHEFASAHPATEPPHLGAQDEHARLTMPVGPEHFHAAGAMHGSILFKGLDDAAFFAANSVELERFVVTVSFTTYLVRPVSSGIVVVNGKLVSRTRSLLLAEAEASVDGKIVARGSGSFMPSRVLLRDVPGYA